MKGFLTITLLCISQIIFAQVDSISLKRAMQKLDQALVQKNETDLNFILHHNASFGHSNGWVQSKQDVLADFKSGKLHYNKVSSTAVQIIDISKKRATVKMNVDAAGIINEKAFDLTMHVMQVWVKTKKGWQLYARQSAKL